jgi:hypothetical protein
MYSGCMSRKRKTGLLDAPGFGGRWFGDRRKKKRRRNSLLISPIAKKKGRRDLIDRASKRLSRQFGTGDDRRTGLIIRLLTAINRERNVFQPPMAVVETDATGQPQSAPVSAEPSALQRVGSWLRGLFRRG